METRPETSHVLFAAEDIENKINGTVGGEVTIEENIKTTAVQVLAGLAAEV